jgi:hypothetical protein
MERIGIRFVIGQIKYFYLFADICNMCGITIEKADYIMAYYSNLLTLQEAKALRHHRHALKAESAKDVRLTRMYLKIGWLTDDPVALNYLNEGYIQFILNCSERILRDRAGDVFFNLCPKCGNLARTPQAKQCRFCGHDWH